MSKKEQKMLKKKLSLLALPLLAVVSLQAQNPMNDPFNDPFFQDPFGDDIFKEMIQMQRQMDEMFRRMQQRINQRSARLVHPSMGMYKLSAQSEFMDKGNHYELVTNIPESKENHINIHTENGMLSITAKIVHEEQQKTNGMISTSKSIQSFQQATSLPADADDSNIKSEFRNGRLVIIVGKKAKSATQKVRPLQAAPAAAKPTPAQPAAPKAEKVDVSKLKREVPKVDEKLKTIQPAAPANKETKKVEDTSSMI